MTKVSIMICNFTIHVYAKPGLSNMLSNSTLNVSNKCLHFQQKVMVLHNLMLSKMINLYSLTFYLKS